MNQAMRLGEAMSTQKIHAIFASDLMRARQTAEAVQTRNTAWARAKDGSTAPMVAKAQNGGRGNGNTESATPQGHNSIKSEKEGSEELTSKVPELKAGPISQKNRIPLWLSPLLREQHFGVIEGKSWLDGYTAYGGSSWREKRKFRTEEGESLEDVKARAERAIDHFILPELFIEMEEQRADVTVKGETSQEDSAKETSDDKHIVLVAHGIFLSEIINALMQRQNPEAHHLKTGGMGNTARTTMRLAARKIIAHEAEDDSTSPPDRYKRLSGAFVSTFADNTAGRISIDRVEGLQIKLLNVADVSHLSNLKRQKGGIGSTAYDPKQRKLDFSP